MIMKQREFFKTAFYHVINNIGQAKLKKEFVKTLLCSEIVDKNAMVDEEKKLSARVYNMLQAE